MLDSFGPRTNIPYGITSLLDGVVNGQNLHAWSSMIEPILPVSILKQEIVGKFLDIQTLDDSSQAGYFAFLAYFISNNFPANCQTKETYQLLKAHN
jgi:hypothetical protein